MFGFGKKIGPTLGLDINSSTISVVQLEKTKTDYKVAKFSSMPTPPDIVREGLLGDPEAVGTAVRELLDLVGIPNKKPIPIVNVGIPGQAVVIRLMPVPVGMPQDELSDVIRQEAINNLPFPVEEANLDYSLLPSTERTDPDGVKRVDVILAAIQKIVVDSYWRMAETANVQLGRLDISSLSVIRSLAYAGTIKEDNTLSMSVNVRNDATDITLIKNGMPLFSRSVLLGVETLGEAISRSIDSPMDEAISLLPKIQLGAIPTSDPKLGQAAQVARSVFGDLTAEVGRSLEFYMSQVGIVQVDQIILCGPGCVVPGISEFVANRLNIHTLIADPFQNLIYDRAQILDERRPSHCMLLGLVEDPTLIPIETVQVDLNKSGPGAGAVGGEGEEGEEEAEEVDTPWFIPALGGGVGLTLISLAVWGYFQFAGGNAEAELAELENTIAQHKTKLEQLDKAGEEVTVLKTKKEILEKIVNHGTPRTCILEAIRDCAPPGVQVVTVNMTENRFTLKCNASDFARASHYAINLNGTNLLENATINDVHRVKNAPERIWFTIEALIRPEADTMTSGEASTGPIASKPKVLEFFAKWCADCKKLKPDLDAAVAKYGTNVEFEFVDVDDPKNQDLVRKYKVTAIPDIYMLDAKGDVAEHLVGPTKDSLISSLDKLSKVASTGNTK